MIRRALIKGIHGRCPTRGWPESGLVRSLSRSRDMGRIWVRMGLWIEEISYIGSSSGWSGQRDDMEYSLESS